MTRSFAAFNEEVVAALVRGRERIREARLVERQAARLLEQGGHLLSLLPVHFVIEAGEVAELAEAGRALIDVQTKILRHLVSSEGPGHGRDGVLERFRVPEAMRRFVSWDELLAPRHLVARFDILQSTAGYHFCELNVDSCVAGAEIFEFMVDYFDALGVPVRDRLKIRSPLEDLAAFLGDIVRRRELTRVVILDWSVGGGSAGKGYLSFETMRAYLAREVAPIPVFIADEKSYDPAWLVGDEARRTLVHRGFMMEEMDDGGRFLDGLLAAGTTVISTYESEIRMNKAWLALFHDETITPILSAAERELVARYIPYTVELTEANLASFVEQKQAYIFKAKQSFGGAGIRIGDELSAEALEAAIRKDGVGNWTAQRLLELIPISVPHDESLRREASSLVLGLYLYGSRPNGMLVRASKESRIVNVTSGRARMAWAACASEAAAAALGSELAALSGSAPATSPAGGG